MTKWLISILFFVFSVIELFSQSQVIFASKNFDQYLQNIAFAGLEGKSIVTIIHRDQWVAFSGRPVNQQFQFSTPLLRIKSAMGLAVFHESIGLQNNFGVRPSFNKILLSKNVLYSLGIGAIYSRINFDFSKAITPEGIYSNSVFNHQEPIFNDNYRNTSILGLNAAFWFQSKWLEGGISFQSLKSVSSKINPNLRNLAILTLSNEYKLNDFWRIRPIIHVYTNLFQNQIELFSNLNYNGKIFGGIGIRGIQRNSLDAVKFSFGYEIFPKIVLCATVESRISPVSEKKFGLTQEFGLKYSFSNKRDFERQRGIDYNPRWTD
jgi:type IX secretion system PorP/SprF family membrane protein